MSEQEGVKQSEVVGALNELRETRQYVKRKPWVLTEKRAEVFAKAAAKRRENILRRKKEELDRQVFEIERKAQEELASKKPNGQVVTQAPELSVNTMMPNKAPDSIQPPVAEEKKADASQMRIVEKPIVMQDQVEEINHEHDCDDGWMTKAAPTCTPTPQESKPASEIPLQRQTNSAAVAADWAEQQMAIMASRKRALALTESYADELSRGPRMGTGAGNHAPYESDEDEPMEYHHRSHSRHMVSPEEALELLAMPKDVALRYLASRISAESIETPPARMHKHTMLRPVHDRGRDMPVDEVSEFLSHTRHHAMRHPSQLHSSTQSSRYSANPGDQFLWL